MIVSWTRRTACRDTGRHESAHVLGKWKVLSAAGKTGER